MFRYKKLGELLFTFSANDEAAFGVIDELIESAVSSHFDMSNLRRGALAAALFGAQNQGVKGLGTSLRTDQGEENCLVALK